MSKTSTYTVSVSAPPPPPPPPPTVYTITVTAMINTGGGSYYPLSGVSVYLDGSTVGTTDTNGNFVISQVPAGSHTVTVSPSGLSAQTQTVSVSSNVSLTFVFTAPGA